jgi:hypothetical protein
MNDVEIVRGIGQALPGSPDDYEPLLELIDYARIALLGEASHGTHEFYSERAAITKRMRWNRWNAQAFLGQGRIARDISIPSLRPNFEHDVVGRDRGAGPRQTTRYSDLQRSLANRRNNE